MVVIFIILIVYVFTIATLLFGFAKMRQIESKNLVPKTTFSIVVPFRNEAENLPKLLHSISLLNYPNDLFEIILVDDDSEEENIIKDYNNKFPKFFNTNSISTIITKICDTFFEGIPNKIKINEPDSPGRVIPETPIIPQIKTNQRLSFSFAGLRKLIPKPIKIPIITKIIFFKLQSPKSLAI